MPLCLLFLVLIGVCFSTIFLMEQKPEEAKSTISKPPTIPSRNNLLAGDAMATDSPVQNGTINQGTWNK